MDNSLKEDLASLAREVRETHISWVFLHDDEVYKVKKPVALGFLDFSTLPLRKAACDAEVSLNQRLAAGVYRGVIPVTLNERGQHQLGGTGPIVDWAVVMRRLQDATGADRLLEAGNLHVEQIDRIARHLVTFHASTRCDAETTAFGDPVQIAGNVRENFSQARQALLVELGKAQTQDLERGQIDFISSHGSLFRERMARGRVRDGHGDLKLEHCYLEGDQVVIVDCIEFNDRFRYGDVCSDLAFLAMDLSGHHRVDLAERLLATYALESNDYDLYALIDFYQGYRACVRAKVASMLAQDESAILALRDRARQDAHRHFLLALAEQHRSLLRPCLVAVGGIVASGKSTFADRLNPLLGGPVVCSDRVRKHLAGVGPTTLLRHDVWQGDYTPEMSARVYDEVLRRARTVLASGRPVILDCSFRAQADRERAQALAQEFKAPFCFVECHTDLAVCRARLAERNKTANVSDAHLSMFEDFARSWEPVTGFTAEEHLRLNTEHPLDENLAAAARVLPTWPAGLRG